MEYAIPDKKQNKNVCLYNNNHVDYNNEIVKSDALNNIFQKMHKFFPNLQLKDIKDKIKTMRAQAAKEMSCIDDKYESKLYISPLETIKGNVMMENPLVEDPDYVPSEESEESQDPKIQISKRIYCKRYRWAREDLKKFIKLLYKYNVLYDSSNKDYLNRELRFIAYKKLHKEMRKIDPKITLNDVRDKMRCLRKQYMKEVRLVKKAQKSNEIYQPVLWCFGLLLNLYNDEFGIKSCSKLFDDNVTTTHPSEVKLNNPDHELFEFEEEIYQDDDNDTECPKETVTLPINSSEEVNYEWLGELVVSQLEEISQNYHTEFAWDVQCLIRKYILKSNAEEDESPAVSSSGTKKRQRERIPIGNMKQRPSNVSFNIRFN